MEIVLKVTGRCGQGCDGCNVYFGPDRIVIGSDQWGDIQLATIDHAVQRVAEALEPGEPVFLVLHGGEPLLVPETCIYAVRAFREAFGHRLEVRVQTGGVPLGRTPALAHTLRESEVRVGVSYDGYPALHDRSRPLLGGGASSDLVQRGIAAVRDAGVLQSIYTRIFVGADPIACYEQVLGDFTPPMWDLLLMDGSWVGRPPALVGRARGNGGPPWEISPDPAPYATFLAPIWGRWVSDALAGRTRTHIRIFAQAIRALRGAPEGETFDHTGRLVTIAAGGEVEHVDRLRTIARGAKDTGLSVAHPGALVEYFNAPSFSRGLPGTCAPCRWAHACRGGNPAHRWHGGSWDNPTVYCQDMNALLELVQDAIATTPRVLLLGARPSDVLSVAAEHHDLLGLIDTDLRGVDRAAVHDAARTGLVLVKPAPGAPKLAALAACTADGELLLHAEDQRALQLLGPLLARLIKKAAGTALHVPSPAPAHLRILEANGFAPDPTGAMVLAGDHPRPSAST